MINGKQKKGNKTINNISVFEKRTILSFEKSNKCIDKYKASSEIPIIVYSKMIRCFRASNGTTSKYYWIENNEFLRTLENIVKELLLKNECHVINVVSDDCFKDSFRPNRVIKYRYYEVMNNISLLLESHNSKLYFIYAPFASASHERFVVEGE